MLIPYNIVYITALIPAIIIWFIFFFIRKDLRKELVSVSIIIGILSVITSYCWWTVDWWKPMTIFGTKVGIEDFILGFTSGGIMSVVYEIISRKRYDKRNFHNYKVNIYFPFLLLAIITEILFWGVGITSFWASTTAMVIVFMFMIYKRKDLFTDALITGIITAIISLLFYMFIIMMSKTWIDNTYLGGLSGIKIFSVPIEEFIFWFLAGLWVGPIYEYSKGIKLKNTI